TVISIAKRSSASCERAPRASHAPAFAPKALRRVHRSFRGGGNGARRHSGARESVSGSSAFAKATADTAGAFRGGVPRGEAPRKRVRLAAMSDERTRSTPIPLHPVADGPLDAIPRRAVLQ